MTTSFLVVNLGGNPLEAIQKLPGPGDTMLENNLGTVMPGAFGNFYVYTGSNVTFREVSEQENPQHATDKGEGLYQPDVGGYPTVTPTTPVATEPLAPTRT